jgi:anti-anti-sigma regulatory factor/DNA-directed RNA polymerase subunit RPC12/RpoP
VNATTQQLGKLTITRSASRLELSGRLDDAAPLSSFATSDLERQLVIDTGGISFVNSIGIREWMRLLRTLREAGIRVVLENVASVLITQMNMIPEARGEATIASFHALYVCERCGAEATPRVEVAPHREELAALRAPSMTCGECGGKMELGDYPERYLTVFRP